jgi:hypothetical protein
MIITMPVPDVERGTTIGAMYAGLHRRIDVRSTLGRRARVLLVPPTHRRAVDYIIIIIIICYYISCNRASSGFSLSSRRRRCRAT